MIPHVGVRLHGTEWFYSDVIESRPAEVMREMLESFPQVTFDLGKPTMTAAEVEAWVASSELQDAWQCENAHVGHALLLECGFDVRGPGALRTLAGAIDVLRMLWILDDVTIFPAQRVLF